MYRKDNTIEIEKNNIKTEKAPVKQNTCETDNNISETEIKHHWNKKQKTLVENITTVEQKNKQYQWNRNKTPLK